MGNYGKSPTEMCAHHSTGIASSLKSLLKDPDATVRHKATEVLYILAGMNSTALILFFPERGIEVHNLFIYYNSILVIF